jgi:hypothetical protein
MLKNKYFQKKELLQIKIKMMKKIDEKFEKIFKKILIRKL